jgi:hypothetical protein
MWKRNAGLSMDGFCADAAPAYCIKCTENEGWAIFEIFCFFFAQSHPGRKQGFTLQIVPVPKSWICSEHLTPVMDNFPFNILNPEVGAK